MALTKILTKKEIRMEHANSEYLKKFNDQKIDLLRIKCCKIIAKYRGRHKYLMNAYYTAKHKPLSQDNCEKIIKIYNDLIKN